jgi:hypothetical protein
MPTVVGAVRCCFADALGAKKVTILRLELYDGGANPRKLNQSVQEKPRTI